MKVTAAQINTTPGDFQGNSNLIRQGIIKAVEEDSDLVIFPEMTIAGYNCRDLLFDHLFIEQNLKQVQEIVEFSKDYSIHIVVGYADYNRTGIGKPFRNMAAVIHQGIIVGTYQKQLLPMGDVFDEARWFEPGTAPFIFTIGQHIIGVTICEDCWREDKGHHQIINHKANPVKTYRDLGCDTLVSLNSSPYCHNKPNTRRQLFREICTGSIKNFVYANQYGSQDELVFDGNSMIVRNNSIVKIANPPLQPLPIDYVTTITVDLNNNIFLPISNENHYICLAMVLLGLHDYAKKTGMTKFVVGSSGGIDSAVVIALAAMVFGAENVYGIKMPSKWSSDHSLNDARQLHKMFGINDLTVQIDHNTLLDHINHSIGFVKGVQNIHGPDVYNPVADENIQARMRGQIVMHFSNATGALAFVTANKTESALGYSTLFGDLAGTFAPIGDLYKLEVYELAKQINQYYGKEMIPQNIIDKAPSAELAPNQTDEASLLPYPILDPIVKLHIEEYTGDWIGFKNRIRCLGSNGKLEMALNWVDDENNREIYEKMINRINRMEFKRRLSPLCPKLTNKSFGTGRRMPIVRR